MVASLLELLRCPVCLGALEDRGWLECASCGRRYPVEDGIPRLADLSASKLREVRGWVELARKQGWYRADDEVDAALPYVTRDLGWEDPVWRGNEHSFGLLLERYARPGMRVLEVGAAKCWAAQHLIPLGCEYVGTDILADDLIGLGRGSFYADRVGAFGRVQADAERLPFAPGVFDFTFCVAALHHAASLERMVAELARVTRAGGIVAALSEATRPLWRRGEAPQQRTERELGIDEHAHPLPRYLLVFRRAGLRVERLETADGFVGLRRRRYAGPLLDAPGARLAATLAAHLLVGYGGISVFSRKRERA